MHDLFWDGWHWLGLFHRWVWFFFDGHLVPPFLRASILPQSERPEADIPSRAFACNSSEFLCDLPGLLDVTKHLFRFTLDWIHPT